MARRKPAPASTPPEDPPVTAEVHITARRVEYIPLTTIERAPRNPKKHDERAIEESFNRFGIADLPLIDERTGRLIAGEGRINQLTSMQKAGSPPPAGVQVDDTGEWLVPVLRGWASKDDQEADAYLVISNRLVENGGWDEKELMDLLHTMDTDLRTIAITDADFDQLMRDTDFLGNQATAFLDNLLEPTPAAPTTTPFSSPETPPATADGGPPPAANPFTPDGSAPVSPGPQTASEHTGALPPQAPTTGATDGPWFQLAWTVDHTQRETIRDAIRVMQTARQLPTAVAALTAIAQFFLDMQVTEPTEQEPAA